MIHSLFIVNSGGEVFLEKHWRSVVSRSVCEYFLDAQRAAPYDVPPVIATPHYYLITVQREAVSLVAACKQEVPPLFCDRVPAPCGGSFQDYFGDCSETVIKDNYVVVYELLDEMLDNRLPPGHGEQYPEGADQAAEHTPHHCQHRHRQEQVRSAITEKKALPEPSHVLHCSVSTILPSGQLSAIPWRRSGVRYTNNEAYFDVIEEVDAIIDKSGSTVFAEIQGHIDCCIKLSGMPDLTLSFMNPRLFDDVSFHPCVRFKRWEAERLLSFIPPDGNFRLMSYHISSQSVVAIPIYIRHNFSIKTGEQGRLDLTIGPRNTLGRTVDKVRLELTMPRCVLNCLLTPNQGKYTFDSVSKTLSWDVGRIDVSKLPNIRGSVSITPGTTNIDANPSVNVQFQISQLAVSGLKVNRLDMYGEKYKPFKGVKYLTKAGKFQVRM
ncbi:GL26809 [Drosophila persimilis]|uniref:GL26809 n=1 Tax=Drosophila persimilis TaxID=7234 RepID=B4H2D5_DROPE|nr:GL26809 [Drosophila persimilis]